MRLLIIISSYPTGEHTAGLFLPDLIAALNARGCEVHVLTQNCERCATEHKVIHAGFELTTFGWRGGFKPLVSLLKHGPRGWLLAAQYLRSGAAAGLKLARAWRPDFILAEWLIPAGLIARKVSRRTGIPYAARALGSDVMLAGKNPLLAAALRRVARGAAVLFADGYDLCRRTSALAGGRACHFTPTVRQLGSERSGFAAARREGEYVLVCVGRLHRTKGQDVLLEALALNAASAGAQKIRCYLVGAGEERERLAAQIERLGLGSAVALTGRLPDGDIRELLGAADAAVIPSRSESIPLVLHEAVAAGLPVIATDVGDMGELVRRYELGWVVPPDDAAALAGAIAQAAEGGQGRAAGGALRDEFLQIFKIESAAETLLREMQAAR